VQLLMSTLPVSWFGSKDQRRQWAAWLLTEATVKVAMMLLKLAYSRCSLGSCASCTGNVPVTSASIERQVADNRCSRCRAILSSRSNNTQATTCITGGCRVKQLLCA